MTRPVCCPLPPCQGRNGSRGKRSTPSISGLQERSAVRGDCQTGIRYSVSRISGLGRSRSFVLAGALGCVLLMANAMPARAASPDASRTDAGTTASVWSGPRTGPVAVEGRSIVLLADDLRNGGVVGVAQGVREAAAVLKWTVRIVNAGGTASGRARALATALDMRPDGLVLCGSDAVESQAGLAKFAAKHVPVVGWHAAALPGPVPGTPVAMNVSTDPRAVGRIAAMAAVAQSGGHLGAVIFTDSSYAIARAKSDAMEQVIRACADCSLLEVRDVALTDGAAVPGITRALLARYGRNWTYALAINDVVFDHALPELIQTGVPSDGLSLVSAGDGSASAFLRIQARTFQTATVAEPLNQQGWQLLDEMNRLFAGAPVSLFVVPPHLVTGANMDADGGVRLRYDPDDGYREAYRRIWGR
jgi:ribose transport system substrate-binding protein